MKFAGFWALLLFVGTSSAILSVSACVIYGFSNPKPLLWNGDNEAIIRTSRKLKENGHGMRNKATTGTGIVALDDYYPIDPVPSSKASIKPGPIEHGTPLQPFIPRPSPPSHQEIGGPT